MIIGICDDERKERERIQQVCELILEQMECPAETALYEKCVICVASRHKAGHFDFGY